MSACSFIKRTGERCRAQATTGSEWCWAHAPELAEERDRARSRGGRTAGRGRPKGGKELAGIKHQLQDLADGVLEGRVDRADGAVVAQLLNTLLRAVETERRVKELEEVAVRLDELESYATSQKRGGRWTG